MRRVFIGAVALLALGALIAYRYQEILIPWIEGKSNVQFIVVSGNIEAHESVVSFKTVQSRIVELPFDEGQTVKAGTVLARVDDADYKQQVDNRRGRAQRADAPARRRRNRTSMPRAARSSATKRTSR